MLILLMLKINEYDTSLYFNPFLSAVDFFVPSGQNVEVVNIPATFFLTL